MNGSFAVDDNYQTGALYRSEQTAETCPTFAARCPLWDPLHVVENPYENPCGLTRIPRETTREFSSHRNTGVPGPFLRDIPTGLWQVCFPPLYPRPPRARSIVFSFVLARGAHVKTSVTL